MRLFVALELPEEVRDALITWRLAPLSEIEGLAPVARESMHVTLCFLGMRPAGAVAAIGRACEVVSGVRVGGLVLDAPVWLPRRRPRVLAVAITDPTGALGKARERLAGALEALGEYAPEARAFLAHVSVCRVRRGAGVRAGKLAPLPRLEFEGSSVTLFRSHLGRGPARYEALNIVALGGG